MSWEGDCVQWCQGGLLESLGDGPADAQEGGLVVALDAFKGWYDVHCGELLDGNGEGGPPALLLLVEGGPVWRVEPGTSAEVSLRIQIHFTYFFHLFRVFLYFSPLQYSLKSDSARARLHLLQLFVREPVEHVGWELFSRSLAWVRSAARQDPGFNPRLAQGWRRRAGAGARAPRAEPGTRRKRGPPSTRTPDSPAKKASKPAPRRRVASGGPPPPVSKRTRFRSVSPSRKRAAPLHPPILSTSREKIGKYYHVKDVHGPAPGWAPPSCPNHPGEHVELYYTRSLGPNHGRRYWACLARCWLGWFVHDQRWPPFSPA